MNVLQEAERVGKFWSDRYKAEGHIWGDEASLTAQTLADNLDSVSKVLEVGFGYGRDLVYLVQHGHNLHGVEVAAAGLLEARELLSKEGLRANLINGDFSTVELNNNAFDAVYSHRMLHLLGQNGLVQAFASKAAAVLKPKGLLYVSARDERDFDPETMIDRTDGMVEYRDASRKGHLISLWNENRFTRVFERKFDIERFVQGTEIESQQTGKPTHFTLMIARKKAPNAPAF